MLIFPEATTSNGTHIMKFKRGAFAGEKRVRPMLIKVDPAATTNIYYDPIAFIPLLVVQMCYLGF